MTTMTASSPRARPNAWMAGLGFAALIGALLTLLLVFEAPRVTLHEGVKQITAASRSVRTVYIETEPVGAAVSAGGVEAGYMALRFRIGLPGKPVAKRLDAMMPKFYGAMLQDFTVDPITTDRATGKLDLLDIEARAHGQLEAILGPGFVTSIRVVSARRHTI